MVIVILATGFSLIAGVILLIIGFIKINNKNASKNSAIPLIIIGICLIMIPLFLIIGGNIRQMMEGGAS